MFLVWEAQAGAPGSQPGAVPSGTVVGTPLGPVRRQAPASVLVVLGPEPSTLGDAWRMQTQAWVPSCSHSNSLGIQPLSGPQVPCLHPLGGQGSGRGSQHQPVKGAGLLGAWARPDAEPAVAHPQLLATAVVFLCGNLMGAFHKHHMQDASRDLFTYTVKCIQIRRKLRIEKRQQVGPAAPRPPAVPQAPCPVSFL